MRATLICRLPVRINLARFLNHRSRVHVTVMRIIIEGDCIDLLAQIKDKSIDFIFADPPYNLNLGSQLLRPDGSEVVGVKEEWDRYESFGAYDKFLEGWLTHCRRILKPSGSIAVIGSYHNIFRVGAKLQDLGFWIQNDIIWRKSNPTPNFRGTRLTNAQETIIWASANAKKAPKFNYKSLKAGNDDSQMRSDWLLPICQGAERLRDASGRSLHPTQKPLRLLERLIAMTTNEGDIVLDPFAGTGTTGVAAARLNRRFIGFERDPAYASAAKARLKNTKAYSFAIAPDPQPVRYPTMVELVDRGDLQVGDTLLAQSNAGPVLAKIAPTGEITTPTAKGSIHSLTRTLGIRQTNGWLAWRLVRRNHQVLLDDIRKGKLGENRDYHLTSLTEGQNPRQAPASCHEKLLHAATIVTSSPSIVPSQRNDLP